MFTHFRAFIFLCLVSSVHNGTVINPSTKSAYPRYYSLPHPKEAQNQDLLLQTTQQWFPWSPTNPCYSRHNRPVLHHSFVQYNFVIPFFLYNSFNFFHKIENFGDILDSVLIKRSMTHGIESPGNIYGTIMPFKFHSLSDGSESMTSHIEHQTKQLPHINYNNSLFIYVNVTEGRRLNGISDFWPLTEVMQIFWIMSIWAHWMI